MKLKGQKKTWVLPTKFAGKKVAKKRKRSKVGGKMRAYIVRSRPCLWVSKWGFACRLV